MPDARNLVQKGIYCQPSPTFENLYDLPVQVNFALLLRRCCYCCYCYGYSSAIAAVATANVTVLLPLLRLSQLLSLLLAAVFTVGSTAANASFVATPGIVAVATPVWSFAALWD